MLALTPAQQAVVLASRSLILWGERQFAGLRRACLRTVPAELVETAGEDALIEAIGRHDPARGRLSTIFSRCYRSRLLRLLERETWPVRYWKGAGEVYELDTEKLEVESENVRQVDLRDEVSAVCRHLTPVEVDYMTGTAKEVADRTRTSHQNVYSRRAVIQRKMQARYRGLD